jgi:hypothetical protein
MRPVLKQPGMVRIVFGFRRKLLLPGIPDAIRKSRLDYMHRKHIQEGSVQDTGLKASVGAEK